MLTDIFVVLLRRRWWIAVTTILCGVAAFFVAMTVPKTYSSKAILRLNGESTDNLSSLLAGGTSSMTKGLLGQQSSPSVETFAEILMSREVLWKVVEANKLDTVYKKSVKNLLLKMIEKDLTLDPSANGIIECDVEQNDSVRAYKVLDSWISAATKRYTELENAKILQTTDYLRLREHEMEDSFERARDSLLCFYRKNGIFDAQEQVQHSIEALANIEATKGSLQVEESVGRFNEGGNSGNVALLEARKKAVTDFQQSILNGKSGKVLINPHSGIALVLEEKRLQSSITLYAAALQTIVKERLAIEAKLSAQTQTAQLIQSPYIPDWKEKPKKGVWGIAGMLIGFFVSVSIVVLNAFAKDRIAVSSNAAAFKKAIFYELFSKAN